MKHNKKVVTLLSQPFMSDIESLRKRARQHIESGAVTTGYAADREAVIRLLNQALATELICVLRYKRHYFMAKSILAESVKAEFLAHSIEVSWVRFSGRASHQN